MAASPIKKITQNHSRKYLFLAWQCVNKQTKYILEVNKMRNLGSNTYLDLMGNRNKSNEQLEKEEFSILLKKEAETIAARIPELVTPLIDDRVAELFASMPDCLKQEDRVTHEKFDELALRNMFAGIVANKLGLGFSTLRK